MWILIFHFLVGDVTFSQKFTSNDICHEVATKVIVRLLLEGEQFKNPPYSCTQQFD